MRKEDDNQSQASTSTRWVTIAKFVAILLDIAATVYELIC